MNDEIVNIQLFQKQCSKRPFPNLNPQTSLCSPSSFIEIQQEIQNCPQNKYINIPNSTIKHSSNYTEVNKSIHNSFGTKFLSFQKQRYCQNPKITKENHSQNRFLIQFKNNFKLAKDSLNKQRFIEEYLKSDSDSITIQNLVLDKKYLILLESLFLFGIMMVFQQYIIIKCIIFVYTLLLLLQYKLKFQQFRIIFELLGLIELFQFILIIFNISLELGCILTYIEMLVILYFFNIQLIENHLMIKIQNLDYAMVKWWISLIITQFVVIHNLVYVQIYYCKLCIISIEKYFELFRNTMLLQIDTSSEIINNILSILLINVYIFIIFYFVFISTQNIITILIQKYQCLIIHDKINKIQSYSKDQNQFVEIREKQFINYNSSNQEEINLYIKNIQKKANQCQAKFILNQHAFFKNSFSTQFIDKLTKIFIQKILIPGEKINQNIQSNSLILVQEGELDVYVKYGKIKRNLGKLKQNDLIGLQNIINNSGQQSLQLRSTNFSKVLFFDNQNFLKLLKNFKKDFEKYQFLKDYQSNYNKNCDKCFNCQEYHSTFNCSYLHYKPNKEFILLKHLFDEDHQRFKQSRTMKRKQNALGSRIIISMKAKEYQTIKKISILSAQSNGTSDYIQNLSSYRQIKNQEELFENDKVESLSSIQQNNSELEFGNQRGLNKGFSQLQISPVLFMNCFESDNNINEEYQKNRSPSLSKIIQMQQKGQNLELGLKRGQKKLIKDNQFEDEIKHQEQSDISDLSLLKDQFKIDQRSSYIQKVSEIALNQDTEECIYVGIQQLETDKQQIFEFYAIHNNVDMVIKRYNYWQQYSNKEYSYNKYGLFSQNLKRKFQRIKISKILDYLN